MTNTKFRKRALLSSVAMLLVALVALGSATFAWFSTKNDATATGLSSTTVKSTNLLLKENLADTTWASSIDLDNASATVASATPITFDGTNWKTTIAKAYNTGYAASATLEDQTTTINGLAVTGTNSYVAYDTIFVKYGETGTGASGRDLQLTVTAPSSSTTPDLNDYIRVAVVPVEVSTDAYKINNDGALILTGDLTDYDFSKSPASYIEGHAAATANDSAFTHAFAAAINLGQMDNAKVYGFKVYAYCEGTDKDCIDTNAGCALSNFTFSFQAINHV